MRLLLAVAAAPLALTACFGAPGEPLQDLGGRDFGDRVEAPGAELEFQLGERALVAQPRADVGQPGEQPVEQPAEEPTFREVAIAEVAATVELAALRAYDAADAGLLRDRETATAAAIDLSNAAALVQQRVAEMQAFSVEGGATGDCGSEPGVSEPEIGGITDEDVNNAVVLAAFAAEAAGEIAGELNPPSTTVCGDACGSACEEVPGTVDEVALAGAIQDAVSAGDGCADVADVLEPVAL